jgi:very-short-patch-repair endonuclease
LNDRRTLSLRGPAQRKDEAPRQSWNVSETRRERLKEMARTNRRNPSEAEKALWPRLAGQKLGGFKFHRQVVVGSAIVDFACPARWLVVDVSSEANAEVLAIQDRKLTEVGIRVLRFSPDEVLEDVDSVSKAILEELQKPFNRRAERAANAAGRPATPAETAASHTEDEELFVTQDDNESQHEPMANDDA